MNSDERSGWNELMEVIKMENHQSPHWSMSLNSPEPQHMSNVQPQEPISPVPAQNNFAQNQNLRSPNLRIVEQPAAKALRFRYECEGRSAGSIPGANSTPENKTFPTVEIVNYDKDAVIVVSCVTKDSPYRPHPHKVVGRDGGGQKYDNGICEVKLKAPNLRAVFSNLGIQCVKRREVATSLKLRRDRKINPFNVPYPSPDQKSTYDLNVVRLCFQAFINPTGKSWEPLEPKISEPIYDKKGVFDLKICGLCNCSGNVKGGDRIILLCEKVDKTDIKIKFSECNNEGEIKWTKYADFQQSDVHKQTAITFRTPRYERTDITESVKVYIQLERPTDGGLSEPLEFEYYPDPDRFQAKRLKSEKLKEISDLKKNLENCGLFMDMNGHYQVPIITTTTNNLETPANVFTMPQFKTEPVPSPDFYVPQHSPCSVVHSPMPQGSPTGAGSVQYTNLQPSQNTNQFLSPMNQLQSTSGGSISYIPNDQMINQQNASPNSMTFQPNIPMETKDNNTNSMQIDSEERIEIVNQLLAGGFETFCNVFSNSITDNTTGTDLPPLPPELEEGLTESGLLTELAGEQLMEIASLSVSGETSIHT